jgi:creatinine amidohydrolase
MVALNIEYGITSSEFENFIMNTRRAIIPVGSLEQHGDHLPVSTDSVIAEHIAKRTAQIVDSFVFPVISYGISFEHKPLFNVSVTHSTFIKMIHDILVSLAENGLKRIIIINGHHGNNGALQYIMHDLYRIVDENVQAYGINYWHLLKNEFDHGGEVETSIMLAIEPTLVRMNKAKATSNRLSKSKIAYQSMTNNPGSFPKITGNGIWGDPRNATARKGHEFLEQAIKNLANVIAELD